MDINELEAHRRVTEHFIADDPYQVRLSRHTVTPNSRGGVDRIASLLPPQDCRILTVSVGATTTIDGVETRVNTIVVFRYNADVERDDEFDFDAMRFKIVSVDKTQKFQIKAEAIWASS